MTGIKDALNVTLENITNIGTIDVPTDFYVNVNNDIYAGFLYFILLIVLWYVLGKLNYDHSKERGEDDILVSMLESGAIVSIISILLRGVEVYQNGVVRGLLSDFQMWLFPLITVGLALVVYSTSE